MTIALAALPRVVAAHRWARFGLLPDLAHPRQLIAHLTPNWYASVMGTGIVAVAATSLPVRIPGLRAVATGMWLLATFLLVALTVATVLHWRHHPEVARGHVTDPVMGHFYGAPPMAMLTVGTATLLVGPDLVGPGAAVAIDGVLWVIGTIGGLVSAVAVPYLLITRRELAVRAAFGGWLMSVVPPMVSASTGALLLPHPAGPARMVPTLLIVLGPLGQSITAVNLLGGVAHLALPGPEAAGLQAFAHGSRRGALFLPPAPVSR